MHDDPKESKIAGLVGFGVALVFLGVVGFALLYTTGVMRVVGSRGRDSSVLFLAGFAALGVLGGLGMVLAGLLMGSREAFTDWTKKPVERAGPVYVVACLVQNAVHEPVFDPEMYDPEDLKYYVLVKFQDGSAREFETAHEVLVSVGEGMWGYVVHQGKWLCSFERVVIT